MLKKLELKIPPVLLVIICSILIYVISKLSFNYILPYRAVTSLTLLLLFLVFCSFGVLEFFRSKTTVDPRDPQKSSQLVTRGVYQYSRNPMYLSFLFFLLALSFWLNSPLGLIICAFYILYMNTFQISPEERALLELFGEPYMSYCREVRRWI